MGRPREPWKREKLLDAAMSTVAAQGMSGLTVKEVAQRAGVSPGTIHYHFADLDGLVLGVVERALDEMYTHRLGAIENLPSLTDKLVMLIDLGIPDELSHEVTFLYDAISVVRANPKYLPALRSYVERQASLYRSVIDAGISTGAFIPTHSSEKIARNLLALEDAYDLYRVLGLSDNGQAGRLAAREYAGLALGIHL